jgi:hypothetical protein
MSKGDHLIKSRTMVQNHERYPSATLKTLHLLTRDNRLSFDDPEWRSQIETICSGRLNDLTDELRVNASRWSVKDESVMDLYYILTPLPYLPNVTSSVIKVVDALLSTNVDSRQTYEDSAANPAWCLGACFKALSQCKQWSEGLDVDVWFKKCISSYAWNPSVLEGLAHLSQFWYVYIHFPLYYIDCLNSLASNFYHLLMPSEP